MMWVGEHFLGYGKIITPAEVKKRISEVTASEIRVVAKDFFQPERMNLALVSPLKKERGLDKLLKI